MEDGGEDMKDMTPEKLKDVNVFKKSVTDIVNHSGKAIDIIVFALINLQSTPLAMKLTFYEYRLRRFLANNLSAAELNSLLGDVVKQMDLQNFFMFMVSVQAVNLLGTRSENKATSGKPSGE